jgi:hypothetical protein
MMDSLTQPNMRDINSEVARKLGAAREELGASQEYEKRGEGVFEGSCNRR